MQGRLKIDEVQQRGLDDLRLENRALNAEQRFVRENHRAFRDSVEVAVDAQVPQVIKKTLIEKRLFVLPRNGSEIRNIRVFEMEVAQEADYISQPAGDGEA